MIDHGLPYHPDMFSTGETPHGCGDVPRTVHRGIRSTAADFITKTYRRDNITIKTEVTVDKIIMSRDFGELSATGVATISKAGTKVEYHATKEIIVTAGAYCSPPILMRSGLGPKEQLEKHHIECLVDLPGVGSNLQDHVVCRLYSLFATVLPYPSKLTSRPARLRLLRSLRTKSHKRLPCLPRQRYRLHLCFVSGKENRPSLHVPIWNLRVRPP
jgi:choline dehydrogenase-like flavoprotein